MLKMLKREVKVKKGFIAPILNANENPTWIYGGTKEPLSSRRFQFF